jgi:predicted ribosome quality control (RQC) complex YloA/Tae2 family protein
MAESNEDIAELRAELERAGVVKKKASSKGARRMAAGKPLHFVSSDGYDIYVGKNNIQNEELTFGLATGKDIWFHAKQMPGSHVIVKVKEEDNLLEDVPDRVFEEAAGLAAFYSSGADESDNTSTGTSSQKIEVDYTERKNLKKPPQARPGYVIYHTNYSIMAAPSRDGLRQVTD